MDGRTSVAAAAEDLEPDLGLLLGVSPRSPNALPLDALPLDALPLDTLHLDAIRQLPLLQTCLAVQRLCERSQHERPSDRDLLLAI